MNQAVRQFGGTLGVAVTIALVAGGGAPAAVLADFDRVWMIIVAGGLLTTAVSLPLRTSQPAAVEPAGPEVLARAA